VTLPGEREIRAYRIVKVQFLIVKNTDAVQHFQRFNRENVNPYCEKKM